MSGDSIVPIITTANIDRAERYYVDTLGLEVIRHVPDEGETTGLDLGKESAVLVLESGDPIPGTTVLAMKCDDVIGRWLELCEGGHNPNVPAFLRDDLACNVLDPDGHAIRLTQRNDEIVMSRDRLLDLVRVPWEDFGAILENVNPDRVSEPGAHGIWSVKDIMAHLAWWENRMLGWIGYGFGGDKPTPMDFKDLNRTNEATYHANKDRDADDVRREFVETHERVVKQLAQLSDNDVSDPERFEWHGGEALWILVAHNTFDHYPRHAAQLVVWLRADK